MTLTSYKSKRDFRQTPEPPGKGLRRTSVRPRFVVQKHAASQLHYDFRLELDGVLLSWAVPKGPSVNPQDKRLAIQVEDHPLEYADFEGRIPSKQYGAGTVMLWDRGTWTPTNDAAKGYREGSLKFKLNGRKLHGGWALVKTNSSKYKAGKSWLLIKERDRYASAENSIVAAKPNSVKSGRDMDEIAGAAAPSKRAKSQSARAADAPQASDTISGVRLTHPDKILYEDWKLTKRGLAQYYAGVAGVLLPHLRNRPLTIVRCPDGWNKACFYQKHGAAKMDSHIERVAIAGDSSGKDYLMANSVEALVALVQMGVLELHPWGSTRSKQAYADRLIFDFDPDDGMAWPKMVEAVESLRTLLTAIGLRGFLKTTGGKGLHVVIPVRPTLRWDEAKNFTKSVAARLVEADPERYTANARKASRIGKIYIDYLRNAQGATAIAPYSTRARESAPVAMPIAWTELDRDLRYAHFNVANAGERLGRSKDPWADFFEVDQSVTKRMQKIVGL